MPVTYLKERLHDEGDADHTLVVAKSKPAEGCGDRTQEYVLVVQHGCITCTRCQSTYRVKVDEEHTGGSVGLR